jgi:hypothetical protein
MLLDLHERIAMRYDEMGAERVTSLFADQRVHTTRSGAELSAEIVIAALRNLAKNPLAPYRRPEPAAGW